MKSFSRHFRFLVALVVCLPWPALAQNQRALDSLENLLQKSTDPVRSASLYIKLSETWAAADSSTRAYRYAAEAMRNARISGDPMLISSAFYTLGYVKAIEQQFDSVVFYQERAISHANPVSQRLQIAKSLNEMGIAYEYLGSYPQAILHYFKAIKIFDALNDKRGLSNEYTNIGLIYHYQKQFPLALKYFEHALRLCNEIGYETGAASARNNIGMVYYATKEYARAIDHYTQVLQFDLKAGNRAHIGSTYNNIGEVYFHKKEYTKARQFLMLAEHYKAGTHDSVSLMNTYVNLGRVNRVMKDYASAEMYLGKAFAIASRFNFKNLLADCYLELHNLASDRGRDGEALGYYRKYVAYQDSMERHETDIALSKLQSQFDLDKANNEILLKETEIEGEKKKLNIVVVAALVFMLLSGMLFYNLNLKRKLYRKLNANQDEIKNQNQLLSKKNVEVEKAREDAEEAARAKSQFLSVMSHEIRTPLNAIIGVSNLLSQNDPREDQLENLNVLKLSSQNLLQLINDVLDLSKLEAGKVELENIDFSISSLMYNLKEMFTVSAKDKGLKLVLQIDPLIPERLKGDPLRMNQVLSNIIANAIKFTHEGGIVVSAEGAGVLRNRYRIRFSVTDTGIGIPFDKQSAIFESFTQAEYSTSRRYGGTGLGLSISRKLLKMANSDLHLESEPGTGSTFSFILTFESAASDMQQPVSTAAQDLGRLKGKKVLIAEDNPVNVMVLKQFLKKWELEQDVALNGEQAVQKVAVNNYDLILMDVHMPEMDGLEAAKIVRNELMKSMPIIALTASHDDEMRVKVFDSGMNAYIVKPFDPDELFDRIAEVLWE